MLDKIIHFSINNKFIIGLFTLVLILVGAYSAYTLPIDALPDITNNQVQIITTSPNLATQDVEQFITYPIEQAVKPIPNVIELRSISRFGLSVITVVFTEDTDIYWARAQISERLKEAESSIPKGMGAPEMAPVSTGLGEIYQYIVFPKPGYEDKFDAIELRTIQDWIIKPQLIGTKGVAEVNTLGGKLKQYEISVNPDKLKSMDITIVDIFDALENNNENTGGAYIDKKPYAYFIRAVGMLTGIDDINKIVVKNQNGIPILMRDVATVQIGSSIRYGAVTKDGQGEDVQGMVMMLKGENSGQVVNRVKEKMEQIKKSLPEGVDVVAFMDRSELVDRAISTVEKNLIEGALMAAGLWWFALATPFREHRARRAARDAALIARAEAGHAAFLVNDPAAFSPPPPVEVDPQMAKGLKIAIATAVGFAVLFTGSVVFGDTEEESQSAVAVVRLT